MPIIDDSQRVQQLGTKERRASLVVGERNERADNRRTPLNSPETALNAPRCDENMRWNTVARLDILEQCSVLLEVNAALIGLPFITSSRKPIGSPSTSIRSCPKALRWATLTVSVSMTSAPS